MRNVLLSLSVIVVFITSVSSVVARDVLERSRPEDATSSLSLSKPVGASPKANSSTKVNTSNLSTEERIARLERILESQGLVDMMVRIENLQSELQILTGEIELHSHALEEIKQRQRDLYVDIDRRLLRLERNGPGPGDTPTGNTSSAPASPVPVSPTPTAKKSTVATTPNAKTAAPAASFASEQKAYQQAFDLLRDLRYEQAVKAFQKFITQFPNGRYAHIAQYWIGEANYAQRNFKQAIVDYQKLIDSYPNSPKLAEAMLKIGYSQYELKRYKQAEATLNALIKNYPGTTESGQATNMVQKIRLKR